MRGGEGGKSGLGLTLLGEPLAHSTEGLGFNVEVCSDVFEGDALEDLRLCLHHVQVPFFGSQRSHFLKSFGKCVRVACYFGRIPLFELWYVIFELLKTLL